jgi:hypothetical protein
MFTQLTDLGGGTYGLPRVGSPLRGNKGLIINGIRRFKHIFGNQWTNEERLALGIVHYVETNYDRQNYVSTGKSDALDGFTVTTTHTMAFKAPDLLKTKRKQEVINKRTEVARGGIVYADKNLATDGGALNDINLIFNMLNSGVSFPEHTISWDTMDGDVFTATEAQFLAFVKAVAQHRVSSTKAAKVHTDAIDALTTSQQVMDYDMSSGWPSNPVVAP